MKKLTLILTCFCWIVSANAQIVLEHTLDSTWFGGQRFYCTDIGDNDYKYIYINDITNSFRIHNLDMSPFSNTITIPVNDSIKNGYRVLYVTKSLFDCNTSSIEYVFTNPVNVQNKFYILRTDGTTLLEIDSANGPYGFGGSMGGSIVQKPILQTSDGAKLYLQKYDINNVPRVLVYSLCGELPNNYKFEFQEQSQYLKIFPNPSQNTIIFEIDPPNNLHEFYILIYDSNNKEVMRKDASFIKNLSLDVSGLSSGIYFYSLSGGDKIYQSGKIVLTK